MKRKTCYVRTRTSETAPFWFAKAKHSSAIIRYHFGTRKSVINFSFLSNVRERNILKNIFCARRQDKVNHCRIRSKLEKGKMKYYLIDSVCFDSLYNLIAHYRVHPLRSQVS